MSSSSRASLSFRSPWAPDERRGVRPLAHRGGHSGSRPSAAEHGRRGPRDHGAPKNPGWYTVASRRNRRTMPAPTSDLRDSPGRHRAYDRDWRPGSQRRPFPPDRPALRPVTARRCHHVRGLAEAERHPTGSCHRRIGRLRPTPARRRSHPNGRRRCQTNRQRHRHFRCIDEGRMKCQEVTVQCAMRILTRVAAVGAETDDVTVDLTENRFTTQGTVRTGGVPLAV